MSSLMAQYGVTTERALTRAIAAEYTRETGERWTIADAALLLDGMLEAEYQRIEGGAYDRSPVNIDADRITPVEPRDPVEVYGTFEHEQWLIEMERHER
jgi:hypothetical protein